MKLIRRFYRLLRIGLSPVAEGVKIEHVLRRGPVESPSSEHARDRTLIDDNPCSG
jgi:hypothetical protein